MLPPIACLTFFIVLIGCLAAFAPPPGDMRIKVRVTILVVAFLSVLWVPWATALVKWNYYKAFPPTEVER